jgi:hypothetical protein
MCLRNSTFLARGDLIYLPSPSSEKRDSIMQNLCEFPVTKKFSRIFLNLKATSISRTLVIYKHIFFVFGTIVNAKINKGV